jgi:predicted extracellular nuclease
MNVTSMSRRWLLPAVAALALPLAWSPLSAQLSGPADLLISEYIEGSSNNKAIEIYNGTGAGVDLAAGGYSVQMFFNGSATAGLTINLTGTVAAGDVFVLAHASANAAILAQADQTNLSGWFNGDDAIVLRRGTAVIDSVGQVGFDPGTEWGTGLASTADNTLRRDPSVCTGDTDPSNAFDPATGWTGFATDTVDGLGAHAVTCVAVDVAPAVSAVSPANGAADAPPDATIRVTFSEPVSLAPGAFALSCAPSGTRALAVTGGPSTFTLDPAGDLLPGETCTLTVSAAAVTDLDPNDPPDGLVADYLSTFAVLDVCAAPFTPTYAIQGRGASAAITGAVRTRGVVIGDYEVPSGSGQLRGFYIQDSAGDGDAGTSDAVFVFGTGADTVALGDLVSVSGTAGEFQDQTQVSAASVVRCGTGTVAPVDVTLPLASADALEPFEGMLVRLPQTLTVTEHFQLGRFGQVVVSSGGRLVQPTDVALPGPAAQALQAANDLNRLIVDDGTNLQNPDPIVFGRGGLPLSGSNTLRGGDTVTGIVGVLTYTWAGNAASGNAFRVRPVGALTGHATFVAANPRPTEAPEATGTLRVASMNLLNFFNTFGTTACTGGVGGATLECRGAGNAAEFARQWPKTIAAVVGTGADIVGVIEIENDGYDASSAIRFLVDRLNAATSPGTYAFIDVDARTSQTNALGTDAIKVGLVYKPLRVIPVGETAALNTVSFETGGDGFPRNRPALAQAFEELGTGARLVVSVNHLKSKGSACDAPDAGDGQGECTAVRTAAARELTSWLASDPTGAGDPDALILGDLNAYAMEDPVTAIEAAGYTSLAPAFAGDGAFSYVFDGQWGSLDHALASDSLAPQVTYAQHWLINADEPSVLDYNTDFKSAGQLTSLYAADEFRVADHNPVLVDLDLDSPRDTSSAVFGFGQLLLSSSAGLKAGDAGSKAQVAVAARFARLLRRPLGQATVIVRRTEADGLHVYQVRARQIATLLTDRGPGTATIIASARIKDVTKPQRPVLVDAQAMLRITVDDNGNPGRGADAIGVTVLTGGTQLWFSSNWDGSKTADQAIAAGNVRVR